MADAHFHWQGHYRCREHGGKEGREFIDQERAEQKHRPTGFVAIHGIGKHIERGGDDLFNQYLMMALPGSISSDIAKRTPQTYPISICQVVEQHSVIDQRAADKLEKRSCLLYTSDAADESRYV